jgi:translin
MMENRDLRTVADDIVTRFEETNVARDQALAEGRQIVRLSANTVRAVHRGQFAEAGSLLEEASRRLRSLTAALAPYPNLYWAGYVQDAMKEYAEAAVASAVVQDRPIPTPTELGVEDAAYLNALAEAASELRRQVLDLLRAGDLPRAEHLLATMDDVYAVLVTIDFPDAITGGLRRTADQLRGVLERTRGDLTVTSTQHRLESALREVQRDLGPGRE